MVLPRASTAGSSSPSESSSSPSPDDAGRSRKSWFVFARNSLAPYSSPVELISASPCSNSGGQSLRFCRCRIWSRYM
eukprot:scaffold9333_cov119-Isochrysis_galbana.AAC.10